MISRPGELRRVSRAVLPTLGFILLATVAVSPHAELLRSDPQSGAVLANSPRRVTLWFSEPIEAVPESITIKRGDGTSVNSGDAAVAADDRSSLTASVELPGPGTYTVGWRAISADGHPISGSFVFSVGRADVAASPNADRRSSSVSAFLQPAGRWLHLLALLVLSGPIAILLLLGTATDGVLASRLWRLARLGAVLTIPAAAVMLLGQTAAIAGSIPGALHGADVLAILHTHWGRLWAVRTLIGLVLVVLTAWRAMTPTLLGIAAVLLATALNGHSAATDPVAVSLLVDWIHLAATAVWAGGLIALSACVLPWTKPMDAPRQSTLVRIAPRFSTVALVCVELLIVTGLYHTWAHLSGPEALLSTDYGRALVVKIGLIALVMAPAAVNLLIVRPKLASATDIHLFAWAVRFRRLVLAEAVLAVAIVGAAAVLTSLPGSRDIAREPPASPPSEDAPAVTFAANAGTAHVTLALSPGRVGSNRVHISVTNGRGQSPSGAPPRLRVEPPGDSGVSPWTVTPARDADGYAAALDFAPAGHWTVHVITGGSETAFGFSIPLRGVGELIALADRAMNRLRSVVEETTVTTAGATSRKRTEFAAPDRMHQSSEEAEEIVVGPTRYMHHGTLWHAEQIEPFRWPLFAIAETAQEAVLAGTETLDGEECVVVQFVDGGARHRLWIATKDWRVVQRTAISREQTVVTRYSRFDQAARIQPPGSAESH